MITSELKALLSFKIKSRSDGYTDQFNRIFIVKILMLCSVMMGINWYKDSVECHVPGSHGVASDFVSESCWIQGIYIYKELADRVDEVAFYGMPKSIDIDGIRSDDGSLCRTKHKLTPYASEKCIPLTKTYYLQYQWMPFYIATLAILFYLPYIIHGYGNSDMISLKKNLKSGMDDSDKLVETYFNHRVNTVRQLRSRVCYNYLIKILYLVANLVAFLSTDSLLQGKFRSYGIKWVKWSKLDNHIMHDYLGMRDYPKPGNEVLPPFGYCTLYEASIDQRTTRADKHTFICELSQNILYQYCLILIWFVLIAGIIVSVLGFVMLLLDHIITLVCVLRHGNIARRMYEAITLRECEYLEFIRRRNMPLYADILQKLRVEKYHMGLAEGNNSIKIPMDTPPPGFDEVTTRL